MEFESDDLGNQQRERLAQHRRLRLYAANAPAENSEAVDHRGVRVRADERIGECQRLAVHRGVKHDARQIFQVDLMDDACIRRNNFEIVERLLSPAEESVTLYVAVKFEFGVERE